MKWNIVLLTLVGICFEIFNRFLFVYKKLVLLMSRLDIRLQAMQQKHRRLLFAVVKKNFRKQQKVQLEKQKLRHEKEHVTTTDKENVVGATKTVFISELPKYNEPEPFDSIELPLDSYEEEPGINPDEINEETKTRTPEDIYNELGGERLYDNIPMADDEYDQISSGATIEELAETCEVLNEESSPVEKEKRAAHILNNLNGSDIFNFLIIQDHCNKRAKELMDKNFGSITEDEKKEEKGEFNVREYIE